MGDKSSFNLKSKEIQITLRFFLVIAQANSNQFNQSINLSSGYVAEKKAKIHAVGSNSLETTYILFKLPYLKGVADGSESEKVNMCSLNFFPFYIYTVFNSHFVHFDF